MLHAPTGTTFPVFKKAAILAVLYMVTGKLGLLLALPPGYATVIWPPSGIALGALIVHGWRLWPGILLGSLLLNLHASGACDADQGTAVSKCVIALIIATGSTLQALAGWLMVKRLFRLPLELHHIKQVLLLFAICCPAACVIAASIGTGGLYVMGEITAGQWQYNWLTWWLGDIFGVVVFLPLVLVAPHHGAPITWRGNTLGNLPMLAMLTLLMPLGLTFYAWKITTEKVIEQQRSAFESLAQENQDALTRRLDSYEHALLGGVAYSQGTQHISRQDWQAYVNTIDIKKNLPGISGLGKISVVPEQELGSFVSRMKAENWPSFEIHPKTQQKPYYVIYYIEPYEDNKLAIGLNIAFEENRLEAAELSRDSGKPAITKKIALVQDEQKTPGFLLLHPVYKPNMPIQTMEDRRKAISGWVYAPFIAKNFLQQLTKSQGSMLDFRIYDGNNESPEAQIYASNSEHALNPRFTIRKRLKVMQQEWLLVWSSTPLFEQNANSSEPLLVIVGGLIFTGLFGIFLMTLTVQRAETMESILGKKGYSLPLVVLLVGVTGTSYLYHTLQMHESLSMQRIVGEQAEKIRVLVRNTSNSEFMALKRMGQRWTAANGTPKDQWQKDAFNYLDQVRGLKALEWVDASYHVRWVEPETHNQNAIGLNIAFDQQRQNALTGAAESENITLTPPMHLVQGYNAFIAYYPIKKNGQFDGFITGIFSTEDFLKKQLPEKVMSSYGIRVSHEDDLLFTHTPEYQLLETEFSVRIPLDIHDKQWILELAPTTQFVLHTQTSLPNIMLVTGLFVSALLAFTVRAVLTSRLHAIYLDGINRLNNAIMYSASYMIVATDQKGLVVSFNKAAEDALGYHASEVIGKHTPVLWHDLSEIEKRAQELSEATGRPISPGFEVFTLKSRTEGPQRNEWTFIRKDGSRLPVALTVTTLRDTQGQITGYLGVVEDITERRISEEKLQESEQFQQLIKQNNPDLIFVKDRQFRIIDANEAFLNMYPEEMRNNIIGYTTVESYKPSEAEEFLKMDRLAFETGSSEIIETVHMPDNSKRVFHSKKIRFYDAKSTPFILCVSKDITEREKLISKLAESNAELERFAYIASHDMQEPIRMVTNFSAIIAKDYDAKLDDTGREYLRLLVDSGTRMKALVDDLLLYSRVGNDTVIQNEFNAQQSLTGVLENLKSLIEEKKAVITHDTLPNLIGNHVQFMRLMQNLITNAIKYQPKDQVAHIHIGLEDKDTHWCFSVSDNGLGIKPEFMEQIFQPFRRLHSWEKIQGTGLGLSICKKIVEHMGGQIWGVSNPGKGSTFYFTASKTAYNREAS